MILMQLPPKAVGLLYTALKSANANLQKQGARVEVACDDNLDIEVPIAECESPPALDSPLAGAASQLGRRVCLIGHKNRCVCPREKYARQVLRVSHAID